MNQLIEKPGAEQASSVCFGQFRIYPSERRLLESGNAVKLGARAFEILTVLIESAGRTVSKKELMARVWPATVVEEINLRVHVAALRRALGDGQKGQRFIINVAGRGYSFVAPLRSTEVRANAPLARPLRPSHNLPASLTRVVGREVEVRSLVRLARSQRLLTIVGAGGVGKTAVALAVARDLFGDFPHGTRLVELAAVRSAEDIFSAFATALGLSVSKESPRSDLREFIQDKNLLLIVDNCEHVVSEVAGIVEQLLKSSVELRVLATSREPINAEGEWLFRIAPLGVPEEDRAPITALSARKHAAIELFVERAITGEEAFELTDANAGLIAGICRSLDGLPLAIELAAASVGRLGIRELAVRVHEQVSRETAGRRTAATRHQTLRAAFDWSFELLNSLEKVAFQRLAVFKGAFTIDLASALIARGGVGAQDAVGAVMGLAEKSLVSTDITSVTLRHRFLNTVRAYAFEKLQASADFIHIQRWHAEELLKLVRQAELDWETTDRSDWIARYGYAIDDVRAALDWAFSPVGDAALGAALTSTSVPFGLQLARVEEFRAMAEHALYWFTSGPASRPEIELRLRETLSQLANNLRRTQPAKAEDNAHWPDAVDRIESPKNRITPLLRKTIFQIESADYDAALETAARLATVAQQTQDPLAELTSDRVSAQANHFAGNHAAAQAYAERVMNHPAKGIPVAYVPVQTDRQVWMRIVLARSFWMQGRSEQAQIVADEALELAAADSPFSLCQALVFAACPVSIWNGDFEAAGRQVQTLMAETRRYRLENWRAYGEWYECVLNADADSAALDITEPLPTHSAIPVSIGGLLLETILTMNPWITRMDPLALSATGWAAPEKLRIQGEFLLRQAAADARARAEAMFLSALECAESQRALAWRLRAAISLGRFWSSKKTLRSRSRLLLEDVCSRFSEGLETRDFRVARTLIKELA